MEIKKLDQLQTLVSLCKRRGFVFQSSEIYGGLNSCWDYGPLGAELKWSIKKAWWKAMTSRADVVGLDASILMHPNVWKASGHVDNFSDPMIDCKDCKARHRADHLKELVCPNCGSKNLTAPRDFNLMFKTHMGPLAEEGSVVYLRPETAQGIFVNFENVQASQRLKVPFGIAQIGKSFRNEITPGNFIFRTREFEQMEMQYFVAPGTDGQFFAEWKETRRQFYQDIGLNLENIRFTPHSEKELAHYAIEAGDFEYNLPIGWQELEGIHNRGAFDLTQHQNLSGKSLEYFDQAQNKKYIPFVIETAIGCDRLLLTVLCDAYREEHTEKDGKADVRVVFGFHPAIAPVQVALLPLSKKTELQEVCQKIDKDLRARDLRIQYDESQSIGKRYRRQDEIGTPLCVTVDFESVTDNQVTVRHRDSMKQERVNQDQLFHYLSDSLANFNGTL